MNRLRQLVGFLIVVRVIFSVAYAQVQVVIPDTVATIGDTILLPIRVNEIPDSSVYSYQFKLFYEDSVVAYSGYETEGSLSSQWESMQPFVNNTTTGELEFGHFGVNPLSGAGVLIYLKFEAIGSHLDSSSLVFENFLFSAGQPQSETHNGKITVHAPLMSVSVVSNLSENFEFRLDGISKFMPFDTTLFSGTQHYLEIESPQFLLEDTRFNFLSWADGGDTSHFVTILSDTVFQCNFSTDFYLTLQSEHGDPVGQGWYEENSAVSISVDSLIVYSDTTRCFFSDWEGEGEGSYTGEQRIIEVIMNEPIVEIAHWDTQHYLDIESEYGETTGEGWYLAGDTANISVDSVCFRGEGTGYWFSSWVGRGDGSYTGEQRETQIIIQSPVVESAIWDKKYYLYVSSVPEELFEFNLTGWYLDGETFTQIQAPEEIQLEDTKYRFGNWLVNDINNHQNPISITMDTSYVIEAHYNVDSVRVTISSNLENNVSIYVDSVQQQIPYNQFWRYQSVHEICVDSIQSAADSLTRYLFDYWSDGGDKCHEVAADSILKVQLNLFSEHYLQVETDPEGLFDFAETGWYGESDTVELPEMELKIVDAGDTLRFVSWQVDSLPVPGNPIQIQMDKPHLAVAKYDYLFFISGFVFDNRNTAVENIRLVLSGDKRDTVSTTDLGYYQFSSLNQGDYRITPLSDWARFEPLYRDYNELNDVKTEQNFTAIDTVLPVISLIEPNGGEAYVRASTDTIFWEASDNVGIDSIFIELSLNGKIDWQTIAEFDSGKRNIYIWDIPDTLSEQCFIRITVIDYDGNFSSDWNDAAFKITFPADVNTKKENINQVNYALFQNYPNPFNNFTIIRFQIPKEDFVKLHIYNSMGQLIRTLIDKSSKPGVNSVQWNGVDNNGNMVCSGIYFYRVHSENSGQITKKLIYLK